MVERFYVDYRTPKEILETFHDARVVAIILRDKEDELFVVSLEGDHKDAAMNLGEAAMYAARVR